MDTITESALQQRASSIGLSQDRLKQLLSYDPETGDFFWLISSGAAVAGNRAGSVDEKGYISISIGGERFSGHQLAWFYVYGIWCMIDHKERPPSNNAIINIRPATYSQNNHRKYVYNPHGYRGVRFRSGSFQAHIRIDGIITLIGKYPTAAEAGAAYVSKAREIYGEHAYEQGQDE